MYSTEHASLTLPTNTYTKINALLSTPTSHNFLVGSSNVQRQGSQTLPTNTISLINFTESSNKLKLVSTYDFNEQGEILTLESISSKRGQIIATTKNTEDGLYNVGVYTLEDIPVEEDDDLDSNVSDSGSEDGEMRTRRDSSNNNVYDEGGLTNRNSDYNKKTTINHCLGPQLMPVNTALPIAPDSYSDFNSMLLATPQSIKTYDLTKEEYGNIIELPDDNTSYITKCSLDPHNSNLIGSISGANFLVYDVRGGGNKPVVDIQGAHMYSIKDLDYNPNRPYFVATGGEDGLVKFWDLRSAGKDGNGNIGLSGISNTVGKKENLPPPPPSSSSSTDDIGNNNKHSLLCKVLLGHTHWLTTVKYNRFHDQLLASAGTDSCVNLWRVSSISSAPLLELDDDNSMNESFEGDDEYEKRDSRGGSISAGKILPKSNTGDMRLSSFSGHGESVYDIAWSACDAWVFASLSFDGNVVLNHVSSEEKYKILL